MLNKENSLIALSKADLKQRILIGTAGNALDNPEYIGMALPTAQEAERKWQIKKLTYDANGNVTGIDFAQLNGAETNDFVHGWQAIKEVFDVKLDNTLVGDETLSLDVDGVTVTQAFTTSHNDTLNDFKYKLALEAKVGSAVIIGGGETRVLRLTAETAGTSMNLANPAVTGGNGQASLTIEEVVKNQAGDATSLTYGA